MVSTLFAARPGAAATTRISCGTAHQRAAANKQNGLRVLAADDLIAVLAPKALNPARGIQ
jgi:hypothetical protein